VVYVDTANSTMVMIVRDALELIQYVMSECLVFHVDVPGLPRYHCVNNSQLMFISMLYCMGNWAPPWPARGHWLGGTQVCANMLHTP
jgi:hypothetical protein